ncbi:hypothetical protein PISMIDRAFT_674983, partial [Pisolithus microcarpus 441]
MDHKIAFAKRCIWYLIPDSRHLPQAPGFTLSFWFRSCACLRVRGAPHNGSASL